MHFYLTNAPKIFIILMNNIFIFYLDKFMVIFLDKFLIYYKIIKEHNEHIHKALEVLREYIDHMLKKHM